MKVDQDSLRRKNEELVQAFREKSRKHLQTQELYDKLKRRAMMGQVQEAAQDAVDHTIQVSVAGNNLTDGVGNDLQRHPPPLFSNQQTGNMRPLNLHNHGGTNNTTQSGRGGASTSGWAGFSSQGSVQRRSSLISSALLA